MTFITMTYSKFSLFVFCKQTFFKEKLTSCLFNFTKKISAFILTEVEKKKILHQ